MDNSTVRNRQDAEILTPLSSMPPAVHNSQYAEIVTPLSSMPPAVRNSQYADIVTPLLSMTPAVHNCQDTEIVTPLSSMPPAEPNHQNAEIVTPLSSMPPVVPNHQDAEIATPLSYMPPAVRNCMVTSDNQRFLLLFIMGTYFGPDLKAEVPKKSVLQRVAEGLPSYSYDQLGGTFMKTVEVERVYYYVLRKADKSVIVKPPLLHQFFNGSLFSPSDVTIADHRQFPDLFPLEFHSQSRFRNRCKTIENIVFINNPDVSYIKPEDVERFKRLAGPVDFLLDRDAAKLYGVRSVRFADNAGEDSSKGKLPVSSSQRPRKRRIINDGIKLEAQNASSPILAAPISPISGGNVPHGNVPHCSSVPLPTEAGRQVEKVSSAMLFLPSHPTVEEWNNIVKAAKAGIALTGTVTERQAGPLIGLVDIGVCEDAYLFRISLPGVKKDESNFSCQVESDGWVHIKGVTTIGQKMVLKNSQVFEMQTNYLCQPGQFSVSFQLPGPVETKEFQGNFGTDGILEGIVMKEGKQRQ